MENEKKGLNIDIENKNKEIEEKEKKHKLSKNILQLKSMKTSHMIIITLLMTII